MDVFTPKQYYANHGVPMMKTTQQFYRKYFGLCCEWYLEQKKLNWRKLKKLPVSGASPSDTLAATTRQCKFDSAAMKTVEVLDGKI